MIVGIDTRIPVKNKTGIGYLLENTIPTLVGLDKENSYKLLGDSFGIDKSDRVSLYVFQKMIQRGINFLWKNFNFPSVNYFIGKTDIFFFTNFVSFPCMARKKILLIPDLSFVYYPQFIEKKNLRFLKKNIKKSIDRADKIITISESVKKEIVDNYKIDENRIDVMYLGAPQNVVKIDNKDDVENVKNKYKISGKYILFVGTIEPRKNIKGIIEGYNLLSENIKKEFSLVLCGGKGWGYDEVFELANKYKLEDNIVFTDYIDKKDISYIYSGASLFFFPSFYEGFGMPILEAFTCGVPVLTAKNSSLSEVGGNAVLYCDCNDYVSMKSNIEKVILSDNISREMIKRGYEQLKKFSWDKSVEVMINNINKN